MIKRWVLMVAMLVGSLVLSGCSASSQSSAQSTPSASITNPFGGETSRPSVTAKPTASPSATRTPTPSVNPTAAPTGRLAPEKPTTDLPTVRVAEIPAQAVTTLSLIQTGGPYPYSKDGARFGNRERLLPSQPSGFYTEYTVVTPGSSDRGARRIVAGRDGSRFYSDDHYNSFSEVVDQ